MPKRLDYIINDILESYNSQGHINHLEGVNLPSMCSIYQIVEEFEALIFPGFKEEKVLDTANLKYIVGEKVTHLSRNLVTEVSKSLIYEKNSKGNKISQSEATQQAEAIVLQVLESLPRLRHIIKRDVKAAFRGDPAAKSHDEVILSYPAVEAIMIFRIAHEFWIREVPLIPRIMTEYIHGKTGIDIHPGAHIGEYFFIDHGTGVVIGETTIIGNNVKLYHGVTLGATSVKKEDANTKRHPTIEDDVTIYPGATILGGKTVIGRGSIIGGNVWLLNSVPPESKVYYKPENFLYPGKKQNPIEYEI